MVKAATADSGPLFEIRCDLGFGKKALRRGSRVTLAELERLAPGKAGPLRRTGMIREVGLDDRAFRRQMREEKSARRLAANKADSGVNRREAGGTDEQE
jgi:hypothetical protein